MSLLEPREKRKGSGAQAFEMVDGECVFEQSIAAGADDDGGGVPLLHLWKGDANATCLAEFGLAA